MKKWLAAVLSVALLLAMAPGQTLAVNDLPEATEELRVEEATELPAAPVLDEAADTPAELLDGERTEAASGTCGATDEDDVQWFLYENGELIISGSGAMENYSSDPTNVTTAPWGTYYETIRSVTV